jgi:hypothetical protein
VAAKQHYGPVIVRDHIFHFEMEGVAGQLRDVGKKREDSLVAAMIPGDSSLASREAPNGIVGKRSGNRLEITFLEGSEESAYTPRVRMFIGHDGMPLRMN